MGSEREACNVPVAVVRPHSATRAGGCFVFNPRLPLRRALARRNMDAGRALRSGLDACAAKIRPHCGRQYEACALRAIIKPCLFAAHALATGSSCGAAFLAVLENQVISIGYSQQPLRFRNVKEVKELTAALHDLLKLGVVKRLLWPMYRWNFQGGSTSIRAGFGRLSRSERRRHLADAGSRRDFLIGARVACVQRNR